MISPQFPRLRDRGFDRFWRLARTIRKPRPTAGFTLLELLVALLVGSLITGAMLFAVVNVLQANQREDNRAETQRDMKVALDYISTELREAVFVYDGRCMSGPVSGGFCPGLLSYLPSNLTSATRVPVVAFWRVDELPPSLVTACVNNAAQINDDNPPAAIAGVPCLSRRSYSLVVYLLDTGNSGNWRGRARIRRYELTQFRPDGTRNTGWVDPTITNNNFAGWPLNAQGQNLQTQATLPDGTTNLANGNPVAPAEPDPPVLADFADDPGSATATVACPASGSSLPAFVRTPTTGSSSFYACVRGGGFTTDANGTSIANNTGGRNQEIFVFLRGNAAGRPGQSVNLPTFDMETRLVTRGSYDKNPAPQ